MSLESIANTKIEGIVATLASYLKHSVYFIELMCSQNSNCRFICRVQLICQVSTFLEKLKIREKFWKILIKSEKIWRNQSLQSFFFFLLVPLKIWEYKYKWSLGKSGKVKEKLEKFIMEKKEYPGLWKTWRSALFSVLEEYNLSIFIVIIGCSNIYPCPMVLK
jgi:hypothetical protein